MKSVVLLRICRGNENEVDQGVEARDRGRHNNEGDQITVRGAGVDLETEDFGRTGCRENHLMTRRTAQ